MLSGQSRDIPRLLKLWQMPCGCAGGCRLHRPSLGAGSARTWIRYNWEGNCFLGNGNLCQVTVPGSRVTCKK